MTGMKNHSLLIINLLMPLILGLWISSEGSAQNLSDADSLIKVISGQPDNMAKADNLNKLGRAINQIDSDSAYSYIEQAYDLSCKLNYMEGQVDALYFKSVIYFQKGEYKLSMNNIEKCLELALDLGDSLRLAKGYYQISNVLRESGDYDLSLYYSHKSLNLYLPLCNDIGIAGNYNNIGSNYLSKSEYDSAAFYYLKAIAICDRLGMTSYKAVILDNLSNVYYEEGQYENAMSITKNSLEINLKINNNEGLALDYTNLGRIAQNYKRYKEAFDYYIKATDKFNQIGDRSGLAGIYNNYGTCFMDQSKYDQAIEQFDKAINESQQIGYMAGWITALGNKARALSRSGNIKLAKILYDSCLALTYKEGGKDFRITVLGNISDNYRRMGDYRKAFEYLESKYDLKDSVYNIQKTKVINDLVQKFEKEKDQASILALEKDNLRKDLNLRKRTSQRNAYLFGGLAIIVLTLFVLAYLRQRAAKEKILAGQKIRQLEEDKKMMGVKLLVEGQEEERKRIAGELHDGLGVLLSATKMQIALLGDKNPEHKEMVDKAARLLEQASGDVRKISHNMMPGLLTKLGFFEAVEDLFENITDKQDLNAVCTITGEQDRLAENKEIMLYRIVQEMVNNTLKHAEARKINLDIKILPEMLDIKYSDDGKGFDFKQKLESESIGLKSIQSRVDFLNGKLTVVSRPGEGVNYSVKVPV
jgi:signal transduction histidine kinase/Tfp pilus assembly protein PilF